MWRVGTEARASLEKSAEWSAEPTTVTRSVTIASKARCWTLVIFATNRGRYVCRKQEVKCTKKKGIIIGSVIGVLFRSSKFLVPALSLADPTVIVLLGGLYLYGMWSERRKKQKGSSNVEESQPLSDASSTISDYEKGVVKGSKSESDESDEGHHPVRPLSPGSYTQFYSSYSVYLDSTISAPSQVRRIIDV